MNTIDFTQPGGFPFDQGVLDFLQKGSLMAGQPAFFGGPLCIISGCTVSGASVSSGFVAINGEILPFAGGTITEKVIIQESVTDITYFDTQARPVKKTKTAMFGNDGGVTNYLWANFKRNTTEGVLARLERLERVAAPFLSSTGRGGMVLWNKPLNIAPIPPGWREVEDWKGRLPMGWDGTKENPVGTLGDVGIAGGAKDKTLLIEEIPAHDHDQVGAVYDNARKSGSNSQQVYQPGGTLKTGKTGGQPDGSTKSFSLLNPYRIVMFIEYIGN